MKKGNLLGERLRRERVKQKLSQEKLADLVDCSSAHISHIETGNTIPSLKIIIDIINVLKIPSDLILCDYMEHSDYVFLGELNEIMKGCTDKEVKFVVECTKESLRLFRKYNESSNS